MSFVSLITGRIHFMGGNDNGMTKDVHYCIKDLSSRAMTQEQKKQERLQTQQQEIQDIKDKKIPIPLDNIIEETHSEQSELDQEFKEQECIDIQDPSDEKLKLIQSIDSADQLSWPTLFEEREIINQEVKKEIKLMSKKRVMLKERLQFRQQQLQNPLPDGGFQDAKLVADDLYIYVIGGYHQAYGTGYCRRYCHTDDQWKIGLARDSEIDQFQNELEGEERKEDENYEVIRMLYPNLVGISVCRVAQQWIYSFGGTDYESRVTEPKPPLNHRFQVQVQLSNKIQRINTALWGSPNCRWEEIQIQVYHTQFPRISHCASAHVPDTDYVIIWGGDQEQAGNIGSQYIAVDLKLGLGKKIEQKRDKVSLQGKKSNQSSGIEFTACNQSTRQSTAVSPGYFVQNKLYAAFSRYSLNMDECVISIGSKYEWTSPYTNFTALEVEEE